MKRSALAIVVCCIVAFGAACSRTSTAPAATVNGEAISTQSLIDELDAINGNGAYLQVLVKKFNQRGAAVVGSTPGSFDRTFAVLTLTDQIYFRLVHDEVVKEGLKADDQCKDAARKEVLANVDSSSESAGETTFAGFPKAYQDTLLGRYTDLLVLQAHLAGQSCVSDDAAKAYYDAHPSEFEQTCALVIFAQDQAAVDAAQARLAAGESFASVATSTATGTTAPKDGDVGCKTRGELSAAATPAFFDTAVGQVSAPTPVGSGFILVMVKERKTAALDDVRQQANELAANQVQTAFQEFIRQAVSSATITVDPRYGTWDPTTGSITEPRPTGGADGSPVIGTSSDQSEGSESSEPSGQSEEPEPASDASSSS